MTLILGKLVLFTIATVPLFHHPTGAFVITPNNLFHHRHFLLRKASTNPPINSIEVMMSTTNNDELSDPNTMKIRDIKNELDGLNVSYKDCFDKESLCLRLVDARTGKVKGAEVQSQSQTTASNNEDKATATRAAETEVNKATSSNFDKEAKLEELRSLRVKELRTKCAENNIRWAKMIEKEELVQALISHYEKCADFSPSGTIEPCKVSVITDDSVLEKELFSGTATTPLMLDVFATWCGPCKLMAPQLDDAAAELGDAVRVAKIDSDLHPEWSSKLNVSGLPTIIVFDGKTGKELQRVEGALMKNDLVSLAQSHIH